ncbi:MAG: hypothetical protein QXH67_00100 [Candidatus Bathyarchaeia archaeon]
MKIILDYGIYEDYSELSDLHVYGDLLTLYHLPISAPLYEAGRFYEEFRSFECRLLTLYASYVLARAGYNVSDLVCDDFAEITGKRLYTTNFEEEDWIREFDTLSPSLPEMDFEPWYEYYEKEKGGKLKVIFVKLFVKTQTNLGKSTLDEAETLINEYFDEGVENLVVVHPLLSRRAKSLFLEVKRKMRDYTGKDILLSSGEFAARFIPESRRQIVEENWKTLREKLLGNLQSKYKFLTLAIHRQAISYAEELMRRSRVKYEDGRFEDAIKDAGVACEGLLRVLYSHYGLRTDKELQFNDLQTTLNM